MFKNMIHLLIRFVFVSLFRHPVRYQLQLVISCHKLLRLVLEAPAQPEEEAQVVVRPEAVVVMVVVAAIRHWMQMLICRLDWTT